MAAALLSEPDMGRDARTDRDRSVQSPPEQPPPADWETQINWKRLKGRPSWVGLRHSYQSEGDE